MKILPNSLLKFFVKALVQEAFFNSKKFILVVIVSLYSQRIKGCNVDASADSKNQKGFPCLIKDEFPPIPGSAVSAKGKLATTWSRLKSNYEK